MKKILFLALSILILSACTNKGDTAKEEDAPIDVIENNNSVGLEAWNNIFLTHPDSLTAEQKEAKNKLLPLITESIVIKDNRFHTSLTKEDFEKLNLDPSLYDLLMKNIDEINAGLEEIGGDAQELYDESMKNLPEY